MVLCGVIFFITEQDLPEVHGHLQLFSVVFSLTLESLPYPEGEAHYLSHPPETSKSTVSTVWDQTFC